MGGLSFLKNVTMQPTSAVKAPVARTQSSQAKTPVNADIRIMKDGSVYPSAKLVEQCDLQFRAKDATEKGNGFDVFSSKDFLNTKHWTEHAMFIALVPKNAGKVDLFSSTTYEADDSPKGDVLTQGANTVGKELLAMIENVYGVTLGDRAFIDLKIVSDQPFTVEDNIYYVPKKVSRGPNKGQMDLVRRENLTLYPLAPLEVLEMDGGQPTTESAPESQASKEATEAKPNGKANDKGKAASAEPTLAELEASTGDEGASEAAPLPDELKDSIIGEDEHFALDLGPGEEEDDNTLEV